MGADKCTGMYAREEDIFNAIYRQLKVYVSEHYITNLQHKQQIQQFNDKIYELAQSNEDAWANAMEHYEQYVQGEINRETLRAALDVTNDSKSVLAEIMDCIDKIIVDAGKQIVIKWYMDT